MEDHGHFLEVQQHWDPVPMLQELLGHCLESQDF